MRYSSSSYKVTLRQQLLLVVCVLFVLAAAGIASFAPKEAAAATSSTLNFQARLMTGAGGIVPDGFYNVEFKIYSASAGGSALWTETYYDSNGVTAGNDNRVRVANGYLTVNLGSQTAFSGIDWDQEFWITMNVGGTTQTATPTWDGEMSPRLKLTAVPYAFRAGELAKLTGANTSTLGFATQTAANSILLPDEGGTLCIRNSSQCGFVAGAATNFIQNTTSQQASSNFYISGDGKASASLQAPTFDAISGALALGTGNATSVTLGNATNNTPINLNSGTGTISIGTGAQARTIDIGTGAAVVQTINIGGTGANVISIGNTQTAGSVAVGAAMTTGTITIGGTGLQTGTIGIGTGTGAQGINLGTGGTGVKTIAIGGSAANVITIGNTQTAGSVAIGAAMTTGTITIGGTGLQTGTIGIGTGTGAQGINLGTGGTGVKTIAIGGSAANVITIGNTQTAGSVAVGAAMTTGTITIGGTGLQTGTIGIGTGTGAQGINLGTGGTGVKTIAIGGSAANVITVGNTQTAGSISLGAAMTTGTVNIGGTGLQTGTIDLGVGTGAQSINLGTGGTGAKTVTVGSTASTGTTTVQGGTGGVNIGTGGVANTVQIGNTSGAVAQTINIGTNSNASATNAVVIGNSTATASSVTVNGGTGTGAVTIQAGTGGTINLGNVSSAITQNINVGANATASSVSNVTVGSLVGVSATVVQSGTGNIVLQSSGTGTVGLIQVGAGGAGSTTPDYLALDVKSTTGDPAGGTEGYMYYNTFDNKFRCYQGAAWVDCVNTAAAGVTAVGTIDSQSPKVADGAQIVGTTLYLQTADINFPGLVSTTTQTFAGDKTFTGTLSVTASNTSGSSLSVSNTALNANGSNLANFTFTNANSSATSTTVSGLSITPTGTTNANSNANTLNAINLPNVTPVTNNNFYAMNVGTGYNDVIRYNGTQLISGTGKLQDAAIDSALTYTNLQKVGALNAGSITSGFGTISTGNNITTTAAVQGGTGIFTGANALTLGTTGTSSGAIVFKGSTGASGDLTLQGPANPSASNYTLSIPAITANANVCTDNSICAGYAAAAVAGNYLQQVPTSNTPGAVGANVVAPTANGINGLTVNGTTGTAATAAIIAQAGAADALNVNVTGSSQTNGVLIERTNAGTLTNALAITNTSGTVTNGLAFGGTIGTDITRGSGTLSLQGNGGMTLATNNITRATFDTSNNLYLGLGATAASPTSFTVAATGSSTAGTAGANLAIQGGAGASATTGSAGGNLSFAGGAAGGSGANAGGSVTIQGGASTSTGTSGAVTISSGNSASGTAGNVTVDTGTTSTGTPTVNIGNANAKAIQIGNNSSNPSVSIDSGTGTIAIGTGGQARTINLGSTGAGSAVAQLINIGTNTTAGATNTLVIGSTTATASTTTINGGTASGTSTSGALVLQAGSGGSINIGNTAATKTVNIGATAALAGDSTINIATSSSNNQVVTIGSIAANTNNVTTIQGGSNVTAAVSIQAASAGAIVIGNTNSNLITIGGASGTTTLAGTIKISTLGAVTANSATICRDTSTTNLTACDSTNTTGRPFLQNGNNFGATAVLGTQDSNSLQIITNNVVRGTFDTSNNLYLGNGATAASPNNFAVSGTGSATAGTAGASVTIQGGAGASATTGSAGGGITIAGGNAGGSGNNAGGTLTLQGGSRTGTGTAGGVLVKNLTNGTAAFQIQNASGYQLFNADATVSSGTTNLISNPGFEVNTTGWAVVGSGSSLSRSTSVYGYGPASGTVNITSSAGGTKYTFGNGVLTGNTLYALSFSLYGASNGGTPYAGINNNDGGGDLNCTVAQQNVTTVQAVSNVAWRRYYCSFTTSASPGSAPYIYVGSTGTAQSPLYIDAVQLEAGTSGIKPYQIGILNLRGVITSPVTIRPNINSENALQVTSADGLTSVLNVDTTNLRVYLGGTAYLAQTPATDASDGSAMVGCTTSSCWTNNINGTLGFPGFGSGHGEIAWSPGSGFYFCNANVGPSGNYGRCGSSGNSTARVGIFVGTLEVRSTSDSTTALQVIRQSDNSRALLVDNSNNRVGIGIASGASPSADLSFGVGNRTINILTQTASNTAGSDLAINSAQGNGSGAGGALNLQSGTGGTTGAGGAALLAGGTGGSTSGAGGATTVRGGNAAGGNSAGGGLTLSGGNASGSGAAGSVTVQGGTAAATAGSNGGAVTINGTAGSSTGTGGTGGAITLQAGNAGGSGNNTGGAVSLTAGNSTGTTVGGGVTLQAGTGGASANGGVVTITGGTGGAATRLGGNVTINGGTGVTSGTGGTLTLQGGTGGNAATGGAITVQGGSAGGGNTNGANVNLVGGAAAGTGVKGLVVVDTATFSPATTQTVGSPGTTNVTQSNIDSFGAIVLNATTSSVIFNLTDPTLGASAAGRLVYVIAANGTSDFTLKANSGEGTGIEQNISMRQNTTATMIWTGTNWTAAGASSSTTLQAAYDNTLSSAGGAEIVLNNTATSNGLTVRNGSTTPIIGAILEAQTSIGSNLFSVNNNAAEYASNGGAETAGGTSTTFPASTWSASATGGTQATVSRDVTAGEFVTGVASVKVITTGATTANQGAANQLSSALTPNLVYSVSFTTKGTANFSTLDVVYSRDGTNTSTTSCATGKTVTQSVWTRIDCTFTAPSSGITSSNSIFIRQSNSNTVARTYYIDNLSTTINASATYAADGSVNAALGTNWTAFGAGTTVTLETTNIYDTSGSVKVDTTNNTDRGVTNNLAITPSVSTPYLVSFYAKLSAGTFTDIRVRYSRDGGTNFATCSDYSTQTLSTSTWTKITCIFTTDGTTASNPDLIIDQPSAPGGTRTFYVDALTVTLNSNNSSNVQVGGGTNGGPTTLFTLDRSSTAPIASNNDAYLGSMYYDTTSGRIQCYESDGWGACGAAPDNIVNLNPEYAGAVLNGTGIGTMTADFCSNDTALTVNGSLCSTGQAKNFYKWTSPQATEQTYSIYVTYQLPATFNGFSSDDTVQLVGRVDNTTNASVTYEMYKSTGSTVTQCGTGETNVITGGGGSANTWYSYGVNGNESTGCSFSSSSASNFVIFKINVKAKSGANAYISTLSFTTTGR